MSDEKRPGADTLVKDIAKMSIDELRTLKRQMSEFKLTVPKLEMGFEKRLNDVERELQARFEETVRENKQERKEQDKEHTDELKALRAELQAYKAATAEEMQGLRNEIAAIKQEQAVAKAQASTRGGLTGALSGGGLGAVIIAIKELLF